MHWTAKAFIFFCTTCWIGGISAAPAAQVRLIDTIAVEAPTVHLRDIANIETFDLILRDKLEKVKVADAPNLGVPRSVSAYKIRSLIEQQGLSNIEILGNQSIIETETRTVNSEEIRTIVLNWVKEQFTAEGIEAEASIEKSVRRWEIPAGAEVTFSINTGRSQLVGSLRVGVEARIKERVMTTTHVRLNIALFREVIVATRPILRGEKIDAASVELRRSEVTRSNGMELVNLSSAIEMEAKRNFRVGDLIQARDIEPPIMIERGSFNRIIIVNGSIKMSIIGAKALEPGRKGEMILFKNPVNRRETLHARVIGEGVAMLKIR
ncbi:flagellar basal body P-ring formation protein FlgA [Simkania negevensis]|uniref:Flagellar basal body P-ring formation protein FlgA n=1 Tax=Simkania negevensis TaxID=83561 RepID=A0ABS3AUK9_9BACT|nr:flagellar basal body P-ring formation protein FlgA [Simkania negevensis]